VQIFPTIGRKGIRTEERKDHEEPIVVEREACIGAPAVSEQTDFYVVRIIKTVSFQISLFHCSQNPFNDSFCMSATVRYLVRESEPCVVFYGHPISYQIRLWLLSRSAEKLVHG
jgi:hypothetical protein